VKRVLLIGLVAASFASCFHRYFAVPCGNDAPCPTGEQCLDGNCVVPGGTDLGDMMRPDGLGVDCTDSLGCSDEGAPICRNMKCDTCRGAGDDNQCFTRNALTSFCDPNSGRCVACLENTHCRMNLLPICGSDRVCRGCANHGECDSGVCNPDGSCEPESNITYVDNNNGGACAGARDGSKGNPFCQIQDAITMGGKPIIRAAPSTTSYNAISVTGGTFTIYGPGRVTPGVAITGTGTPAVTVTMASSNLTLDGVVITGVGTPGGISCNGAGALGPTVRVRRSHIHTLAGIGINSDFCRLTVDRTQIGPSCQGALRVVSSAFDITNNMIIGNMSATQVAVSFETSTVGAGGLGFRNNTVVRNTVGAGVAGIACNAGSHTIADSIVWGNGTIAMTTNFGGTVGCTQQNVVSDPVNPRFVALDPPTYDAHLDGRHADNLACCIDKIDTSPVKLDFDGRPRPEKPGAKVDIGAHEVP
jgi:hypothetical protein